MSVFTLTLCLCVYDAMEVCVNIRVYYAFSLATNDQRTYFKSVGFLTSYDKEEVADIISPPSERINDHKMKELSCTTAHRGGLGWRPTERAHGRFFPLSVPLSSGIVGTHELLLTVGSSL